MADDMHRKLTPEEVAIRKKRFLQAVRMQEIVGNPLHPEDIAMFEMFHRLRWSDEKCRAYVRKKNLALAKKG